MRNSERDPIWLQHSNRVEKTVDALADCGAEILEIEAPSPEDAIRLSAIYTAYKHEEFLHTADMIGRVEEIDELEPRVRQFAERARKESIVERDTAEVALTYAQTGNYIPLREYLVKTWTARIEETKGDETDWDFEIGTKMLKLAELLPDRGTPFVPPVPAWMDRRYTDLSNTDPGQTQQ